MTATGATSQFSPVQSSKFGLRSKSARLSTTAPPLPLGVSFSLPPARPSRKGPPPARFSSSFSSAFPAATATRSNSGGESKTGVKKTRQGWRTRTRIGEIEAGVESTNHRWRQQTRGGESKTGVENTKQGLRNKNIQGCRERNKEAGVEKTKRGVRKQRRGEKVKQG